MSSLCRTGGKPILLRLAIGFGLLLPGLAAAEGAVKLLDCEIVRSCDAAGRCRAVEERAEFRMEPEQLEAGGVGTYRIRYADKQAEMQALSDLGPFFWSIGDERHALLISSASQWLWHRLTTAPDPVTTVRFMRCSFQQ